MKTKCRKDRLGSIFSNWNDAEPGMSLLYDSMMRLRLKSDELQTARIVTKRVHLMKKVSKNWLLFDTYFEPYKKLLLIELQIVSSEVLHTNLDIVQTANMPSKTSYSRVMRISLHYM